MNYIIYVMFGTVFAFLIFFYWKSKEISVDQPIASTAEQFKFVQKLRKQRNRIWTTFSIVMSLILIGPAIALYYETNFIFKNLPADRYEARMNDVYLFGLMGIFFGIIMYWVEKRILDNMLDAFYNIILQLKHEDFIQLKNFHQQLGIFDKLMHPMALDNNILWVFKFGRALKIDVNKIEYIKQVSSFRGGFMCLFEQIIS